MPIDPDLIPNIPGSDPTKKVILGTSASSSITFYKNVHLPANYSHIFYWPNKAKQDDYFNSRPKQSYNNVTYINLEDGFLRVGFPIKELKGYTYASIINPNSNYENKKFYYFITGMKSINNNMTEVYIALDVWNTFYFDVTPTYCMIVRQHSKTDELFESLTPEPIGTGTYVTNKLYNEYDDSNTYLPEKYFGVALLQTGEWNGDIISGHVQPPNVIMNFLSMTMIGRFYNYPINSDDTGAALALINKLNEAYGHFDECFSAAYMYPVWATLEHNNYQVDHSPYYKTRDLMFDMSNSWDNIDGYKPHNYKLYQYPYRMFQLYNSSGDTHNYLYEYFNGLSALSKKLLFRQYSSPFAASGSGVEVDTVPVNYKNMSEAWDELVKWNFDNPCILTNDNSKKWWDYNGTKVAIGGLTAVLGVAAAATGVGAAGIAAAGAAGGVASAEANLISPPVQGSTNQQVYNYNQSQADLARAQRNLKSSQLSETHAGIAFADSSIDTAAGFINSTLTANSNPPSVSGSFNASPALLSGNAGTFARDVCLCKTDLKRIDAFFDRYGYTVNQIAIPDLSARKVFTYIQTAGCNFEPVLNENNYVDPTHIAVINSIFDRGVTVWNSNYNGSYDRIGEFNPTAIRNNQVER